MSDEITPRAMRAEFEVVRLRDVAEEFAADKERLRRENVVLLARAEQGERDARIFRHNAENWYASAEKYKSMIGRLFDAGHYAMALLEIRKTSIHDHEIVDQWDALVAEWKEGKQ